MVAQTPTSVAIGTALFQVIAVAYTLWFSLVAYAFREPLETIFEEINDVTFLFALTPTQNQMEDISIEDYPRAYVLGYVLSFPGLFLHLTLTATIASLVSHTGVVLSFAFSLLLLLAMVIHAPFAAVLQRSILAFVSSGGIPMKPRDYQIMILISKLYFVGYLGIVYIAGSIVVAPNMVDFAVLLLDRITAFVFS